MKLRSCLIKLYNFICMAQWAAAAGRSGRGSGASANGTDGAEVSCTIDTSILTAGGGKAGTGGEWGNGSSFHNGQPGKGGLPAVVDAASLFENIEETAGINAITYDRWSTQKGADALPSILGQMPGGGNGEWGMGNWG